MKTSDLRALLEFHPVMRLLVVLAAIVAIVALMGRYEVGVRTREGVEVLVRPSTGGPVRPPVRP